ncbi:MAG TPA: extracellular solute-binding protein [Oscillospiraceae bacterium]|nr:extracellular solute-binding protein [Oscillospiraceae bacterium]HQQ89184.1 extracellular solute-binding protein [Oscillospiraceae bacterium]HRW56896.1 extracellular solute-binding protein [Oscillospiraceae bacterium]
MKKLLSLIALVLALTLCFGGCAGTTEESSSTPEAETSGTENADVVTINILSSDDFAGFRTSVIPEFEATHPGIKINFQSVGYDALHQKEVTALAAGTDTYDVVDVDCIWTPEYVTNGYIECVDDRITDEMKTGILDVCMDILRYDDKMYGLPMFNDLFFMYYNKEILENAGITELPETWEEYDQVCQQLQTSGACEYGSAYGWAQAEGLICYYMDYVCAFGGSLQDADMNPTINTPENVAALQFMVDSLYTTKTTDPASITSDDRNAIELFSQGRLPFCINWSFAWGQFNDPTQSQVVDKVGVMLIPGHGDIRSAACAGSMGLAIASTSQHKDEAWEFISFLASKEIQKRQAIEGGSLPIWADLYQDEELLAQHPAAAEMVEQSTMAYNRPSFVYYNEFSTVLQVEIQNALTQAKTPEQALADAQTQVEQIAATY